MVTAARLVASEQIEHMQALALAWVALLLQAVLEIVGRFVDGRHRTVHRSFLVTLGTSFPGDQDTDKLLDMQG